VLLVYHHLNDTFGSKAIRQMLQSTRWTEDALRRMGRLSEPETHIMADRATKTEQTGAKHGRGAYWDPKREAKKESNTLRRRQWTHALLRDHRSSLRGYAP